MVYTDGAYAYEGLPNHEALQHSTGEYVRGDAHTNGIESFWAVLKRAHKGIYHQISPKHLHRYVWEFCARHNIRPLNTPDRMTAVAAATKGHRLLYRDLIA